MLSKELLVDFETCLEERAPHILSYYNEALSLDEIDSYMSQLSINIPEYKFLYEWKNGVSVEGLDDTIDIRIDFSGNFLTMKDALELYRENQEESYWNTTFVPILATHEGETLLIETNESSENYKQLFFYAPFTSDLEPVGYFDSIESMFMTIISLFNKGAQRYENNGMEIDFELRSKVCKDLNPKSEYWFE